MFHPNTALLEVADLLAKKGIALDSVSTIAEFDHSIRPGPSGAPNLVEVHRIRTTFEMEIQTQRIENIFELQDNWEYLPHGIVLSPLDMCAVSRSQDTQGVFEPPMEICSATLRGSFVHPPAKVIVEPA